MTDKSLKWILLISLMLNAAIGGFTVAQFLRPRTPFMHFSHMQMPRPPEIPEKMRSVLDSAFNAERPSFEKAIKDMTEARSKSVTLIRSNPLDLDALDKELVNMRAANSEAQESFHRVVRSAAQQLDPAGRDLLAGILRMAPPGAGGPLGPLGPPSKAPWAHDAPEPPILLPGELPDMAPGRMSPR
jgi:uncharacterized membrane protein